MRAFRLIGRSLQSDDLSSGSPPSANLSALRNSCPSFHLEIYVYNYTYILASTKCSTWNTFPICSLPTPPRLRVLFTFIRPADYNAQFPHVSAKRLIGRTPRSWLNLFAA